MNREYKKAAQVLEHPSGGKTWTHGPRHGDKIIIAYLEQNATTFRKEACHGAL